MPQQTPPMPTLSSEQLDQMPLEALQAMVTERAGALSQRQNQGLMDFLPPEEIMRANPGAGVEGPPPAPPDPEPPAPPLGTRRCKRRRCGFLEHNQTCMTPLVVPLGQYCCGRCKGVDEGKVQHNGSHWKACLRRPWQE